VPDSPVSLQTLHRIVLDAAAAHTVEEQVERLVSQICDALAVAVCSLYQRLDDDTLLLVSSRGLNPEVVQHIRLGAGEGLVGLVAEKQLPIIEPIAIDHPSFRPFPDSGENAFPSFAGVPILTLGTVSGVLVVQDVLGRVFTDDELSLLITIATQLGPVLLRLSPPSERLRKGERLIMGTGAATGKNIGVVQLVVSDQTLQLLEEPPSRGTEAELSLLAQAVSRADREIETARLQICRSVSKDILEVFDFYRLMLSGDQLLESAEHRIRAGASAFAAVRASVDELVHAFDVIDDEYLSARSEDVRHIGNRLLANIMGAVTEPPDSESQIVLLGAMVSITDIGMHPPEQLAGIVCFQGSTLSHSAMLARALGIPTVIGTGPIDHLHNGMRIVVDGDSGSITLSPLPSTVARYRKLIAEEVSNQEYLLTQNDQPAETTDHQRITLLANTGLLADAAPGKLRGAEGVGLYRSEIPFLTANALPTEAEQLNLYREILALYHPLPVTMRTLDVGGDKGLPYLPFAEENPALGWRGIRFTLDNRTIFTTQLRAMLRANEGLNNLSILLPMVADVREVEAADAILETLVAELQETDTRITKPPVGIMIEIPGVVPLLPRIAQLIDFASIGTNDLTQYLLAADRANPRVAANYDQLHPSVLKVLATIQKSTLRLGLRTTVCGAMAADPIGATLLIGLGFRTLSMDAFSLPKIRAFVRSIDTEEARRLTRKAMRQSDANQVRAVVTKDLEKQLNAVTHPAHK
jgi:phosphotransferase system enzyme I (PtsI)/phosphotransferase system enzyme I (PtsP)